MNNRHETRTAVYILLEKDGKYFFLRRQNTGWADGMLTLPSGHVDKGEFVTDAAIKEAAEETGVIIQKDHLEFVHVDYLKDLYVNFYFVTQHWEGQPRVGEPQLASEAVWIKKDSLPHDMVPQLNNFFIHLKNEEMFSEWVDETR